MFEDAIGRAFWREVFPALFPILFPLSSEPPRRRALLFPDTLRVAEGGWEGGRQAVEREREVAEGGREGGGREGEGKRNRQTDGKK